MPAAIQAVPLAPVADETKWNRTPLRSIRMEDELWAALDAAAKANGYDRSSLVRQLVRWYLAVPGAPLPPRPTSPANDARATGS